MSQRPAYVLALLLTLSLAACGGSSPSLEFGKEDAVQIRQMVKDFTVAYNAKDVAKIGTFSRPARRCCRQTGAPCAGWKP
jgi:predicted small lipoprotein YifL